MRERRTKYLNMCGWSSLKSNIVVAVNIQEDCNFSRFWFIRLIIENIKENNNISSNFKSNFIGNIVKCSWEKCSFLCSCSPFGHILNRFSIEFIWSEFQNERHCLNICLLKTHGSAQRDPKSQVYRSEWWPVDDR